MSPIEKSKIDFGILKKVKYVLGSIFFGYFSYSTVKEVKTYNFLIAFVFRTLQLMVLAYVFG